MRVLDISTLSRHLKDLNVVRRRLNRRHAKKDVGMQLKYLEDMAFVHPSRIVDMDGIHYNPKDYLERYGWTSMGQEAYALQLIIRGNVPLEI